MINPSVASVKYQPVSINHATNLNLKVRTTSANSVRTKREQRTNNARTAYEQRANYERELTRELRDAPLCFSLPGAGGSAQSRLGNPAPSPSPTVPQTFTFRPSAHSRGSVYICLFQSRNKINLLFLNAITRYSGSSPFASGCRFRFVLV